MTADGSGSATSFEFADGKVARQHMLLRGPLDRILKADLPHEMTHIILAHHFGSPVSRWADEGAAVLSADDTERDRNAKMLQQILNTPRRFIPLRRLFAYPDYPKDVTALFAEGYSVTRFLVESKDRMTFLKFVSQGMHDGWDQAVKHHYGYANVDTAEAAWLQSVKQREVKEAMESKPSDKRSARSEEDSLQESQVDRKLALAFGKDCEEVRQALVKVEIRSPHWILATNQITIAPDGRVTITPCWYARFDQAQEASDETGIMTMRGERACFRFDGPVSNISDLANRKLISIEPSGNVRIAFQGLEGLGR